MLKISLDKIQSLFARIAENAKLYLPVDNGDGSATYGEWAAPYLFVQHYDWVLE